MLIGLWKDANEVAKNWIDHTGTLRDGRTGKPISVGTEEEEKEEEMRKFSSLSSLTSQVSGFGFFDVGANDVAAQAKRRRPRIGMPRRM